MSERNSTEKSSEMNAGNRPENDAKNGEKNDAIRGTTNDAIHDAKKVRTVKAAGICKSFASPNSAVNDVEILNNLDLEVFAGETIAIVGPSGSGKTTLLQILGLIEKPTAGTIEICDKDCTNISESECNDVLKKNISFIYQFHHLLPEFSALENVVMPQLISGINKDVANNIAIETLKKLGLEDKIFYMPSMLSGGEQQRVAIARAIVKNQSIVLADEPTGNLDPDTGNVVFDLLVSTTKNANLSLICVTHNHEIAKKMDRRFVMQAGKLVEF